MPTLFTTSRSTSITCTGNSDVRSSGHGTTITYTGALTLNGERITDPKTLRTVWAEIVGDYLADADRTEHGDQREHYTARARCAAYAAGTQAFDGTDNPREAYAVLLEIRRLGVAWWNKLLNEDVELTDKGRALLSRFGFLVREIR